MTPGVGVGVGERARARSITQINFLHGTTLPHRTLDQGGLGCCSWASPKLISSPAILNGPESVRSGCNGVRKKIQKD